jgi:hypothetical protein
MQQIIAGSINGTVVVHDDPRDLAPVGIRDQGFEGFASEFKTVPR